MTDGNFVDLTVFDDRAVLCGTEVKRPAGVSVQSWRSIWDTTRNALVRRGSMRAVNDKLSMSSMDDFRRLANTHC